MKHHFKFEKSLILRKYIQLTLNNPSDDVIKVKEQLKLYHIK